MRDRFIISLFASSSFFFPSKSPSPPIVLSIPCSAVLVVSSRLSLLDCKHIPLNTPPLLYFPSLHRLLDRQLNTPVEAQGANHNNNIPHPLTRQRQIHTMLKFFNLLAVSSLAVFLSTLAAVPGATASPAPSPFHHGVAAAKRSHGHIARSIHARSPVDKPILKKRGVKCRPRDALPAPIPEPSPSPSPEPSPQPSPSPEPSPSPSPSPSPQPETPPATGSGKGKAGLAWAMGNDPAIRTTASSNTAL